MLLTRNRYAFRVLLYTLLTLPCVWMLRGQACPWWASCLYALAWVGLLTIWLYRRHLLALYEHHYG